MSNNLFKEFNENTLEEWTQQIVKDLKGKDFNETIVWESEIGAVNPVKFSYKDVNTNAIPFNKTSNNTWNICQSFDVKKDDVNTNILAALEGGVNSIRLKNCTSAILPDALKDVMLSIIETNIEVNGKNFKSIIGAFNELCSENDKSELSGGFLTDPINNLLCSGNWLIGEEEDYHSLLDIVELSSEYKNFSTIRVDASVYGEAGANIDNQIAYALAHGNEYLNYLANNNCNMEDVINKFSFHFSVGTSYFMEIAKLRAFRLLWTTIVNEYCDAKNIWIKTSAVTSNLYFSNADMNNNMLRATTSAMSAAIAGYDAIEVLPYNINSNNHDAFADRIAKNVQLILQEESHLNKVIDPSNGSYYIEELTNKLSQNAWRKFQEIEQNGGLINALKNNIIQEEIQQNLSKKTEALSSGKSIFIGVNKYQVQEESNVQQHDEETIKNNTLITPVSPTRLAKNYE